MISEDCISRAYIDQELAVLIKTYDKQLLDYRTIMHIADIVKHAPSVVPKKSCYRCGLREHCEDSTERKPREGEMYYSDTPQTKTPKKHIDKPFRAVWLDDELNEIGSPQMDCGAEGEWIVKANGNIGCSICGIEKQDGWVNFCGFCGAKMKGAEK